MLVHYVSKSLHEAEIHYLPLEKDILVMAHATHKLPTTSNDIKLLS